MRILIADKFESWGVDQLKAIASEVRYEPGLKGDTLRQAVDTFEPNLIVVRSTKVPADVIQAGKRLKGIIRAGSGYDNIDVQAASKHGVKVANCPGMNASAVAELSIGLMIALDRRIPDNVHDFRAGRWNKKLYSQALGFRGRTLGILGAGKIGSMVARIAVEMGMTVLYYHLGRQLRLSDFPSCRRAQIDDLLREADVVSIHVPGNDSTRHLIDDARLRTMKPTALLINTSRAGVVDEAALAVALREGRLRGAALDVFPDEPAADAQTVSSPLQNVPNLYVTHHIGASTEEAQNAVAMETIRLVQSFKNTGNMPNCVNLQAGPSARCMLVVRMHNKPGALAHVFKVISEANINAEEMDHCIYDGGHAACAHIRIDQQPGPRVLQEIGQGHPHVIGVDVMTVD